MIGRGANASQSTTALTHFESVRFAHNLPANARSMPTAAGRSVHTDKPGHVLSLVHDFEGMDTHSADEIEDGLYGEHQMQLLDSSAWPIEELARRARATEDRINEGQQQA